MPKETMMRCSQCKSDWKPVNMYNHKKKKIDVACSDCLNRKFMAIMTLVDIDFERIEQEVNGCV